MSVIAQAEALARAGRMDESRALIDDAIRRGDPEALVIAAFWRLYGVGGPRDWSEVHRLLDRAGHHPPALTLRATLTANGTGVPADWNTAMALLARAAKRDPAAKRQHDMLVAHDALRDAGASRPLPEPRILSESLDVRLYPGALHADECAWLVAAAAPAIRPSTIIDPVTRQPRPDPTRRAGATNFGPEREDPVVRMLTLRMAHASGTELDCAEPLAVLRYSVTDEYRPHLDTLPGVDNQRAWTVLCYLNDDYDGGETVFTESGLAVKGKRGDMLVFGNLDSVGRPAANARHSGEPITRGVKWLSSRWIRQRRYDSWSAR